MFVKRIKALQVNFSLQVMFHYELQLLPVHMMAYMLQLIMKLHFLEIQSKVLNLIDVQK